MSHTALDIFYPLYHYVGKPTCLKAILRFDFKERFATPLIQVYSFEIFRVRISSYISNIALLLSCVLFGVFFLGLER